jgi:hypothetical protein
MIDVKAAVASAIEAARGFYAGQEIIDLDLEEVELSDNQAYWLITLGFHVPNRNPAKSIASAMMTEGPQKYQRKYKVFRIDANTGAVMSMKIREM